MASHASTRREFVVSSGALAIGLWAHGAQAARSDTARWPIPPQEPRIPTKVGNFGFHRIDDYAWMRPKDWLAVLRDPATLDPPIAAAIAAENRYADAMLAPAASVQRSLKARADVLYGLNDAPLPIRDGPYVYYTRPSPTGGGAIYLRRPVAGGAEEVLLDPAVEARGRTLFKLSWGGAQHSADGTLIGWAQDLTGSGIFQIRVREIATGRMIVSDIDQSHGEFAFDPAGRYLFWVGRDAKGVANSVWRRDMRTGGDVKVHAEDDPSFFIEVRPLASRRFVLFRMLNGAQTEAWLVRAGDSAGRPMLVQRREPDLRYDVEEWNGQLVILTDADGAPDQKLMVAPIATPDRSHWRPLVDYRPGRFIAAIHPFREHLVREEWRDALPRLVVMDKDGREHDVAFDEPAYAITAPAGQSWDAASLAFTYESPRLPRQAYRLELASAKAEPAAPRPDFASDRYVVERFVAAAADGAQVPITVLRRRDTPIDGKAPLFLYGYGSYGATVPAAFEPGKVALVDDGWIYAIAHVRGGAERGTDWWRQVLGTGKKKTFTDFIACAEHLIARRYATKGRIVAHGYSAGGLLMGAVYTMRPDLWAGVIAQVPFVDPINSTDQYETHPLGATPMAIWGDWRTPEVHRYIESYSPYDNLKPAPYPALLATGNVADERVGFFEPLKFASKARALTTAGNPIMVKIAPLGGHVFPDGSPEARTQEALFGGFATWAAGHRWGEVPQR